MDSAQPRKVHLRAPTHQQGPDTSVGAFLGCCAALEVLLGSYPADQVLLSRAKAELVQLLSARVWPFERPPLRQVLEDVRGSAMFPLVRKAAGGRSSTASGNDTSSEDTSTEEDDESSEEYSTTESEESSSEEEEEDGEEECAQQQGALDSHFVLMGKLGCYEAMRAQCEHELEVHGLLPLLPGHLASLAQAASHVVDSPTARTRLVQMAAARIDKLQRMVCASGPLESGEDAEDAVLVLRPGVSPELFAAKARDVLEAVEKSVDEARCVVSIAKGIFDPPAHKALSRHKPEDD